LLLGWTVVQLDVVLIVLDRVFLFQTPWGVKVSFAAAPPHVVAIGA